MASEKNQRPVAVVVGVGPGLGAALAHRFSKEYAVAIVARRADYLKKLAGEIRTGGATILEVAADVADAGQIAAGFEQIEADLGPVEMMLYNAGSGTWGGVTEITPAQFESTWRTNAMGAFLCVKQVVDLMIARGHGTMIFTGATAGMKAGPRSAAFGPAKFALRGLAQSMARDLGPKGIHCAWVNIDGAIDIPGRQRAVQLTADQMLKPAAIAETYWHLAHQDRSAWTMELEVRPFTEKF
ncbi:MAG: SDR family NAD(P)-dependent oxidoreductase [Candidatus Binataceae bacterium]|nr:SDR family NAD(P)-dependent oxidoreductase [Candidatus Binataceae bacterium]